MSATSRSACSVIALMILLFGTSSGAARSTTAFHKTLRLRITYPAHWVAISSNTVFTLDNFPLWRRPKQLIVPPGGAQIFFRKSDHFDYDDLARHGQVTNATWASDKYGTVKVAMSKESFDAKGVFPSETFVRLVFSLEGHGYFGMLVFREPCAGKDFELTFQQVVRGLEFVNDTTIRRPAK